MLILQLSCGGFGGNQSLQTDSVISPVFAAVEGLARVSEAPGWVLCVGTVVMRGSLADVFTVRVHSYIVYAYVCTLCVWAFSFFHSLFGPNRAGLLLCFAHFKHQS